MAQRWAAAPQKKIMYLLQERIEDPRLLSEVKRGPRAESLGNTAVRKYPCISKLPLTQITLNVYRPILRSPKFRHVNLKSFSYLLYYFFRVLPSSSDTECYKTGRNVGLEL